ncbi:MAG: hypothetical protein ACYC0H_23480, partial [Solirubrobacteraceae bacterium]
HLVTRASTTGRSHLLLSAVLGGIAAGFTEVAGAVLVAGALLAAVNVAAVDISRERRRWLIACFGAIAVGAEVGVAVIWLGPGTRVRAHAQQAGVDLVRLSAALANNARFLDYLVSWRALPAVALGLAFCALRGPLSTRSGVRWLIAWGAFLLFVPLLIVAVMTGYAGAAIAPYRTAFIATASMAAGVGVLTYLAAGLAVAARPSVRPLLTPVALLAMAIGVGGFVHSASPVIRAERLRATLMASRAASIRRQLQLHKTVISIMPAQLIDPRTQAYDLLYGHRPPFAFLVPAIREYYRVPARDAVDIIERQPRGYCLPNVSIPSFGVQSCEQLKRSRARPASA